MRKNKEEIMMKKMIKYAAVGLAGYFIGFYEMKYKVLKAYALGTSKSDKKEESK